MNIQTSRAKYNDEPLTYFLTENSLMLSVKDLNRILNINEPILQTEIDLDGAIELASQDPDFAQWLKKLFFACARIVKGANYGSMLLMR